MRTETPLCCSLWPSEHLNEGTGGWSYSENSLAHSLEGTNTGLFFEGVGVMAATQGAPSLKSMFRSCLSRLSDMPHRRNTGMFLFLPCRWPSLRWGPLACHSSSKAVSVLRAEASWHNSPAGLLLLQNDKNWTGLDRTSSKIIKQTHTREIISPKKRIHSWKDLKLL